MSVHITSARLILNGWLRFISSHLDSSRLSSIQFDSSRLRLNGWLHFVSRRLASSRLNLLPIVSGHFERFASHTQQRMISFCAVGFGSPRLGSIRFDSN